MWSTGKKDQSFPDRAFFRLFTTRETSIHTVDKSCKLLSIINYHTTIACFLLSGLRMTTKRDVNSVPMQVLKDRYAKLYPGLLDLNSSIVDEPKFGIFSLVLDVAEKKEWRIGQPTKHDHGIGIDKEVTNIFGERMSKQLKNVLYNLTEQLAGENMIYNKHSFS